MSGMPVTVAARPRSRVIGTESATPRPFVTINGNGSAGSIHLVGSSAALVEQTRIDFNTGDDVRTVVIAVEAGQASHAFGALVLFDPGDDVTAANLFNSGFATFVAAGESVEFSLDVACASAYIIGLAGVGATSTAVAGRVWCEGMSHA